MDITILMKEVTTYVHDLTNGNEFATGMLLTGISSVAIYQAKNLPKVIYSFLLKHFTTTLDVKDSHRAYYSLIKTILILLTVYFIIQRFEDLIEA